MLQQVGVKLRVAPGFIAHVASANEGSWEVVEVWASEQTAIAWLDDNVFPMMRAAGAPLPDVQWQPVHSLVLASNG